MKQLTRILVLLPIIVCSLTKADEPKMTTLLDRKFKKEDGPTVAAYYQELVGEKLDYEPSGFGLFPRWLKKFETGNTQWMLLLIYPGFDVPDVSYLEAHLFDKDWKFISKHSFSTGYRMFIKDAAVLQNEELGQDLLKIETTSAGPFVVTKEGKKAAFEQGNFQNQFYGILENQLHLVRLEDDQKAIVRNNYRSRIPFKGPPAAQKTKEEWLLSLKSDSQLEQLSSLVWLTASHLPSTKPRLPDHNQQSVADSDTYESVWEEPDLTKILHTLSQSENPWVKEYSRLGRFPNSR